MNELGDKVTELINLGLDVTCVRQSDGFHVTLAKDGSAWLGDGSTMLEALIEAQSHIQPTSERITQPLPVLTPTEHDDTASVA